MLSEGGLAVAPRLVIYRPPVMGDSCGLALRIRWPSLRENGSISRFGCAQDSGVCLQVINIQAESEIRD